MKGCDFVGVAPLQFTDLSSPTFYPEIVSSAKRLMLRLQCGAQNIHFTSSCHFIRYS